VLLKKILLPDRREPGPAARAGTVVVSVEHGRGDAPALDRDALDLLAGRLQVLADEQGLGRFDGCDSFAGQSRLYFRCGEIDRFAAAVARGVAPLEWGHRVRVRISVDGRDDV
jgi:hypothetical protein